MLVFTRALGESFVTAYRGVYIQAVVIITSGLDTLLGVHGLSDLDVTSTDATDTPIELRELKAPIGGWRMFWLERHAHLEVRDTEFTLASRAPIPRETPPLIICPTRVGMTKVRFGITTDRAFPVHRDEVYRSIVRELSLASTGGAAKRKRAPDVSAAVQQLMQRRWGDPI